MERAACCEATGARLANIAGRADKRLSLAARHVPSLCETVAEIDLRVVRPGSCDDDCASPAITGVPAMPAEPADAETVAAGKDIPNRSLT
jgi:hypothetical protein